MDRLDFLLGDDGLLKSNAFVVSVMSMCMNRAFFLLSLTGYEIVLLYLLHVIVLFLNYLTETKTKSVLVGARTDLVN